MDLNQEIAGGTMSNVELMEAAVRANPSDETAVLALTDALIESGLSPKYARKRARQFQTDELGYPSDDWVSANTSRTLLCQYIPNSRRATTAPQVIPMEEIL